MNQSWGLVLCTLNRPDALFTCISCAVNQTLPPQEIIVIDASADWEVNKERILGELQPRLPGCRWVYVPGRERSLTVQRNQGLDLATADVLFMIDDDSYMFRDCAERIMRIYDADTDKKVVSVAARAAIMPEQGSGAPMPGTGAATTSIGWKRRMEDILMNSEHMFVPYTGWPDHQLPESIVHLPVRAIRLVTGFRLTVRREVAVRVRFCELLKRYALCEDFDFSYRISRHGAIVSSIDGLLYHEMSKSGRYTRRTVTTMGLLNMGALLRLHSTSRMVGRIKFYQFAAKRFFFEFVADLGRRRWTLPKTRGVIAAVAAAEPIFSKSDNELGEWYEGLQVKTLERNA